MQKAMYVMTLEPATNCNL